MYEFDQLGKVDLELIVLPSLSGCHPSKHLAVSRSTTTLAVAPPPTPATAPSASSCRGRARSGCTPPTSPSKAGGQPATKYPCLWFIMVHFPSPLCAGLQLAAAPPHPRPAAGADLAVRAGDAAARLHAGLGGQQRLRLHQAQPWVRGPHLWPVWQLQRRRAGRPEDELRWGSSGSLCGGWRSEAVSSSDCVSVSRCSDSGRGDVWEQLGGGGASRGSMSHGALWLPFTVCCSPASCLDGEESDRN